MERLLQHGPDPSMVLHQGSSQAEMDLAELEPSYKTHSFDDSTTERHAAPHNRSQAANDQLPSIDILASKFVGNVKAQFGERSGESTMIYGTLGRFSCGEISKRETISIISDTLGNHVDLKSDLMNILQHQDARWAPGDFDLPQLPHLRPGPQFLQPDHQPQMRLPSMSTFWGSEKQPLQSFNSVVMSGYDGFQSFEKPDRHKSYFPQTERNSWHMPGPTMLSSPDQPAPLSNPVPVQLTSPSIGHMTDLHVYGNLDHNAGMNKSNSLPQCAQDMESWGKVDFDDTWHRNELSISQFLSSVKPYQALHAGNSRLERRSRSATAQNLHQPPTALRSMAPSDPSVPGNSYSMLTGQPAMDMPPPPSGKRGRKSSLGAKKMDKKRKNSGVSQTPIDFPSQRTIASRSEPAPADTASHQGQKSTGTFVHNLCGKGFTSRAKVKKHHWGNKQNDLDTTTGCWAKHNKPDARWDDHSSCKEILPSSSTMESTKARSVPSDHRAPVVPTMISWHRHTLAGTPTLQDLPQAVAAAIKSAHAPSSHFQHGSLQHGLLRDNLLPYNTQSLPSRSPFENLLTAVNVAAKIEAPVPQGRNDSVVFNLDAQALAAERDGQYLPAWTLSPYDCGLDYSQQYLSSPTDDSLGHTLSSIGPPTPRTVAYASQDGGNGYPYSTMSRSVHRPSFRNPFDSPGFVGNGSAHKDYCLFPQGDGDCLRSSATPGTYKV